VDILKGSDSTHAGGEMERVFGQPDRPFRYGDFPEWFWDADPDAVVDVQNPVTLARLLTRGRAEVVGKLVPLEVLQERLDTLPVPEHVRIFWRAVLRSDPQAVSSATHLREES
jgi:hypothetical protein